MGMYRWTSITASSLGADDLGHRIGEYEGPSEVNIDGFLVGIEHQFLSPGHTSTEIVVLQEGIYGQKVRQIIVLNEDERIAVFKESLN